MTQPGPTMRAEVLADASAEARRIAQRCRDKAATKTGDDRKHWHAMAAGASMVALRLIELSDAAGAVAGATPTTHRLTRRNP